MVPEKSPTVSVIIPVYNSIQYLGEAVDSVLHQTFPDYEIIIVDDGSTDDIKGAVQPYLSSHDNIHFVRQKNKGPGPARNTAIRRATGKWIAFLDADDIWCPKKLEQQIDYARQHPDTIVAGGRQCLDCRGHSPVMLDSTVHFTNFPTRAEMLTYLLHVPYFCGLSSLIVSRTMIDTVGMFDESLRTVEDDDLIFRMLRVYNFYSIPDVVVIRRKHNESITTDSALEERIQNKYVATKKLLNILEEHELTKGKREILGYWAQEFARRHLYWNNYRYALKWALIGILFYPQYSMGRCTGKIKKMVAGAIG